MKTEVYKRGPAQFDMCGKFLGYPLRELDEAISEGLALRLVRYALKRAKEVGLFSLLQGWEISISTEDGDERPSDRSYHVTWTNPQGLEIILNCIMTDGGWPFLDHRFSIQEGNCAE